MLAEVASIAARHDEAADRIYPDPLGGAEDDGTLREDWNEHVRPGLEQHFAASRGIVARDLDGLSSDGTASRIVIPADHADAWLNALNQARFVMVAENNFTESDLDHREPPDLSTRRGLALLKVHFFAHVQELLVGAAGD
jgi:hypothetical protein